MTDKLTSAEKKKVKAICNAVRPETITPAFLIKKLSELFAKHAEYIYYVDFAGKQDMGVAFTFYKIPKIALKSKFIATTKMWGLGLFRQVYKKGNFVVDIGGGIVRPLDLDKDIREGWKGIIGVTFKF